MGIGEDIGVGAGILEVLRIDVAVVRAVVLSPSVVIFDVPVLDQEVIDLLAVDEFTGKSERESDRKVPINRNRTLPDLRHLELMVNIVDVRRKNSVLRSDRVREFVRIDAVELLDEFVDIGDHVALELVETGISVINSPV
jgi:hypothetical protein